MISLPQEQFRKGAEFAASVVSRRNTIPVLGTIKVTANGSLKIEGTDLDTYTAAEMPYDGDEAEFLIPEPGKVCSAIKRAGGETVVFGKGDKVVHLVSGDLTADLSMTMHPDDFPATLSPAHKAFSATVGEDFFRALDRVRPGISTEETRYYLNGAFIHKVGDWLYRFAATDGHRLFVADVPMPDAKGDLADGIIIPRRAIDKVLAAFSKSPEGTSFVIGGAAPTNRKDATLAPVVSGSRASFSAEIGGTRFSLATKLIDGTFPDYTRVIPGQHNYLMRVRRDALTRAVRCLTPFSTNKTRAIRLTATDAGATIELHSPDLGKSSHPVAAEHNCPADFQIGLNARYLLDALGAFNGDEIEFGLTEPDAPMTLTDPADTAFKVVQMPMRV